MDRMKFTEEDKEKFVEFLNLVATHGRFDLSTNEIIKYFKCLSHMQQSVLPKMNANILEVIKVHEPEEKKETKPKRTRKKKS